MDPTQSNSQYASPWISQSSTSPSASSSSALNNTSSQYIYQQQQQQQQQQQPQSQQQHHLQQQQQQQQQAYHSPETLPPPSASQNKRSRISRACDTCRKKKIKCDVDNCHPCTTCKQYDWECTFNDTARKRGPPKGYIEGLEARLKRMEQLLGKIQSDETNDRNPTNMAAPPSSTAYHSNETGTNLGGSPSYSASSPAHSGQNSPQSIHESGDGELSGESYLPTKGKVVRYLGSSSGLYLVNDILKNKDQDTNEPSTSAPSPTSNSNGKLGTSGSNVPGGNTTHSTSLSSHEPLSSNRHHLPPPPPPSNHQTTTASSNVAGSPSSLSAASKDFDGNFTSLETKQGTYRLRRMNGFDDDLVLVRDETEDETRTQLAAATEQETMDSIIPRSMLASLVKIYFDARCTTLPILDEEEFISSFEGKTLPPPAPLLTYAICSYACFLVPSDHPLFTESGLERNQIFHALIDRAGIFIRSEYLIPRIQTIQALVLLCAHPTYSSKSYRNWLLAGMAVRMAQDLGLHRSVSTAGTANEIIEKRRRLWYSVYVTDRWCCSVMGRPLAIADSDCDVDLPNVDAVDQPGKYTMFVNLVKLSGILGEILRRIYSPKAKAMGYATHIMEQTVWSLDKMLKEWFDHVPSECLITQQQLSDMKGIERTQEAKFRAGGPLTVCFYAVVVLLFRPFIVFECNNHHSSKLFKDAPKRCMEAARNAIDVARYIPEGEIPRYGWNFAAYSVFQASLIHVYNCTSSDPVVAQSSRDYIRISIDECMAPMTKDIPFGPPAVQFLENLLHLMKADPSFMRTDSPNENTSSATHHSTSEPSNQQSTPGDTATTSTSASRNTKHVAQRPPYPSETSQYIPNSILTDTGSYPRPTSTADQQQMQQSASPMSVHQIVTGMNQPSVPIPSTINAPPPINNGRTSTSTNNDYASNPMDLINLALTQDSLLEGQSNQLTQDTWKLLLTSAGTPFTNNASSGSEFQVSWENMFMEGQGDPNFAP
ncbi:fungal-specific transcription factor domain-domain-containing protein [Absidia repens]|uniref:Fungal-specific transcription factor domain-domain-containing protein n=1 Tax=Absidia repens TaxID=90262 RepID=A0A1X2HZE0_9FUNG|nr:fungal-specific transcription factor domain-domain-containing protein [Absidia repens]